MIKSTLKISLLCLIAAALAAAPTSVRAQDTNTHPAAEKKSKAAKETKEEMEPGSKKAGVTPFHGKLKAVDKTAKTISVGETTVHISSETKIVKAGKPATLEDGVIGEPVAGAYKKADDGKLNAVSVRFGAKPEDEGKPKKEKPEKKDK